MNKLPIGIQSFEKLRQERFLYIDKTKYVYDLATNNIPYFLSRPRRFGKSLLLSTMRAYFEGKKELFNGLAIEKLEEQKDKPWVQYPVFYFDFNGKNYQVKGALEEKLDGLLNKWEPQYGIKCEGMPLEERFSNLLRIASGQSGRRCVILIDEYDKPLLDVIEDSDLQQHNKDVFKGFFSTLKSEDEFIHFIFITGVTKFHKVSIFSDLNQLVDISLNRDYAGICGITEEEIKDYFNAETDALAKTQGIDKEECQAILKKKYDGYKFHQDGVNIYNPYSVMNVFFSKEFGSYWFETGTPSFLVQRVSNSDFDVRKFTDKTLYASESSLKDYTGDSLDLIPLLYQTGYITISDYDRRLGRYTLSFPNDEVKYGFLDSLIPEYTPVVKSVNGLDIFTLNESLEEGNLDKIRDILKGLFASITYTIKEAPFEHYFQSIMYIVFTLLGKNTRCEMHTYTGRIDCVVETAKYVYLFEIKRDDSADAALEQIDSNDYLLPFIADDRKIYKIGVNFSSESRMLEEWKVEE